MFQVAVRTDNKVLIDNKSKFVAVHSSSGFKHSLKGESGDHSSSGFKHSLKGELSDHSSSGFKHSLKGDHRSTECPVLGAPQVACSSLFTRLRLVCI